MKTRFAGLLSYGALLFAWAVSSQAAIQFDMSQPVATGLRGSTIAAGDLNNDGHIDLAVANIFSHSISVLINDGNGDFPQVVEVALANDMQHPVAVTVGDLDGDAFTDMAAAHVQNITNSSNPLRDSEIIFFFGKADGTFDQTAMPIIGVPSNLLIADINADGRNDVVVGNNGDLSFEASAIGQFDGGLYHFVNQGNRAFKAGTPVIDDDNIGSIVDVAVTDFNKDNRVDVIGIDQGALFIDETFNVVLIDPTMALFRGASTGFSLGDTYKTDDLKPWSLDINDFDKDGMEDVALAIVGDMDPLSVTSFLGTNASVTIYQNQAGTFSPWQRIPTPGVAFNVQTDDFDKDGDVDVAVSVQEIVRRAEGIELVPSFRIYENVNGEFTEAANFPIEEEPRYAASGDFNGDGDTDLAVLCTIIDTDRARDAINGRVYVFLNQAVPDITGVFEWNLY